MRTAIHIFVLVPTFLSWSFDANGGSYKMEKDMTPPVLCCIKGPLIVPFDPGGHLAGLWRRKEPD